jgi:hypothetical protein
MHWLSATLHQSDWHVFDDDVHMPPGGVTSVGGGDPKNTSPRQNVIPLTLAHAKCVGQSLLFAQPVEHT